MPTATTVPFVRRVRGFEVSVAAEGGDTVVALRGEADLATLDDLARALAFVVAGQHGDVIVDLAHVDFIDIATLRSVLEARAALAQGGRKLTIRSPSRIATRLLDVFGLLNLVNPEGRGHEMIATVA